MVPRAEPRTYDVFADDQHLGWIAQGPGERWQAHDLRGQERGSAWPGPREAAAALRRAPVGATIKVPSQAAVIFETTVAELAGDPAAFGVEAAEALGLSVLAEHYADGRFRLPTERWQLDAAQRALADLAESEQAVAEGAGSADSRERAWARHASTGLFTMAAKVRQSMAEQAEAPPEPVVEPEGQVRLSNPPAAGQAHAGRRTLGVEEDLLREVADYLLAGFMVSPEGTAEDARRDQLIHPRIDIPGVALLVNMRRADGVELPVAIQIERDPDNRGFVWGAVTRVGDGQGPAAQRIVLRVPTDLARKGEWLKEVRSTLAHEATHVLDPSIRAEAGGSAAFVGDDTAYFNDPQEVTARRHQVFRDLNTPGSADWVRRMAVAEPRSAGRWVEGFMRRSWTWTNIEARLSAANRRLFYEMAAALAQAHIAGSSQPQVNPAAPPEANPKVVHGKVYVHRSAEGDLPEAGGKALSKAKRHLPAGAAYDVVKYNPSTGGITFSRVPTFGQADVVPIAEQWLVRADGSVRHMPAPATPHVLHRTELMLNPAAPRAPGPGMNRRLEAADDRRRQWYEALDTPGTPQHDRHLAMLAAQPEWETQPDGTPVLRSPGRPIVAWPLTGRRNAAEFAIVDPTNVQEVIAYLRKKEVRSWLVKEALRAAEER